jgi:hypothetical protein
MGFVMPEKANKRQWLFIEALRGVDILTMFGAQLHLLMDGHS